MDNNRSQITRRSRDARGRKKQSRRWRLIAERLESRQLLAVLSVTNTDDSDAGSLRAAILDANTMAGSDTITFDIAGTGVQTIRHLSALPDITDVVTIDGGSQPGYSGTPLIIVSGDSIMAAGTHGFTLRPAASGSTIRGLTINAFNGVGVSLYAPDVTIESNYIGTDPTGSFAVPNGFGIHGQSGPYARILNNVISGNVDYGIAYATHAVIQGNRIGTDASGTTALANQIGVYINGGESNLIEGSGPGEGNLISGNANGVWISNTNASNNLVYGNKIGTDLHGTAVVPNGHGVLLLPGAHGNFIGTNGDGINDEFEGNLISGTAGNAIHIAGADDNLVAGNQIGTSIDGNSSLGRGYIRVYAGSESTIIGTNGDGISDAVEGNVIAGGNSGIDVQWNANET